MEILHWLLGWLSDNWLGLLWGGAIAMVGMAASVYGRHWMMRRRARLYYEATWSGDQSGTEGQKILYSLGSAGQATKDGVTIAEAASPPPVERVANEVFVPVHYATNRMPTGKSSPNDFYGTDRDEGELRYGRVLVSLPGDHDLGRLERPKGFWIVKFRENPARHVVLREIEEKDAKAFFADLADDVAKLTRKTAFVFVHGYNVTFAEAARRAAQMAYDLFLVSKDRGDAMLSAVPILFSWPSKGLAVPYTHDGTNAEVSATVLKGFLRDVAARSGADTLVVVGHSMGGRALSLALRDIGLEMREGDGPVVNEIVLAAPDIDRGLFLDIAAAVSRTGQRTTLYASDTDRALQVSKWVNGYRRLGDVRDGIATWAGADSIDASVVGDDILAHSYIGQTDVLNDLYYLINGALPADRFGLLAEGEPPEQHWIMRSRN